MPNAIRHFVRCDAGAVTVDWVILTAIAASFGILVFVTLGSGPDDVGERMQTAFDDASVAQLPELGYSQ
ncbi:hypothetical protein C4N9_04415 [Pararhodobacter marinus]|uniref:Pilus assembly protein n=1 Tax=Pararhodobacter marinus TaxID=2184063 RepID=A0A2U2CGK1_9RHOB|nr:hypothetical protein [Pararhodobacter marinus]PWE31000.1 hypothetical protein C4N9_04415 [Pararhodobacter marinus]